MTELQGWPNVTDDRITRVAKFDRWPNYKGGQIHKFYCTNTNKHHSQELTWNLTSVTHEGGKDMNLI